MFTHNIKSIVTLVAIFIIGTCGAYQDGSGWQTWTGVEPEILALARRLDLAGLHENRDDVVDAIDDEGNSPLHLVMMSSNLLDDEEIISRKIKAVQILVNNGAQLWWRNDAGETAEDLAMADNWSREQRMAAFAMRQGRIFKQQ